VRVRWWGGAAFALRWGGVATWMLGKSGWGGRDGQPPSAVLAAPSIWAGAVVPVVVVDAGHGGVDGGTQGFGVLEKVVALATAERVAEALAQRGVRVVMTRTADETLSLDARVGIANAVNPTALISVHFNFTTASPDVRGVEVYYSDPKDLSAQVAVATTLGVPADDPQVPATSRALADAVRAAVSTHADTPDRGTRNGPDLALTRRTRCPAVLVECAYLSHPNDAARAATAAWQSRLATGIANGVMDWLASQSPVSTRRSDQ